MRVFYTDDLEKRTFYVRIDNIILSDTNNPHRVVLASNGKELLDEVIKIYGFDEERRNNIQIWSNRQGSGIGTRLDVLDFIPIDYEFVYVRGISNPPHL